MSVLDFLLQRKGEVMTERKSNEKGSYLANKKKRRTPVRGEVGVLDGAMAWPCSPISVLLSVPKL